jgi:hypothetical protein
VLLLEEKIVVCNIVGCRAGCPGGQGNSRAGPGNPSPGWKSFVRDGTGGQRKCARASDRTKKHAVNSCTFFFLDLLLVMGPGSTGLKKISLGRAGQLFLAARPNGPRRQTANYDLHWKFYLKFFIFQNLLIILFFFVCCVLRLQRLYRPLWIVFLKLKFMFNF